MRNYLSSSIIKKGIRCIATCALCASAISNAGAQTKLVAKTTQLTVIRDSTDEESKAIITLPANFPLAVTEKGDNGWTKVIATGKSKEGEFQTHEGYVETESIIISEVEDPNQYEKIEEINETKEVSSIGCENINSAYDSNSNSSLIVDASEANYDAIIKLIRQEDDNCIRMLYIKGKTKFTIKNIPYGIYYLKTAIGNDLRMSERNGCLIAFAKDGIYKRIRDTFDFESEKTEEGHKDISWEFVLHAVKRQESRAASSEEISIVEFNK